VTLLKPGAYATDFASSSILFITQRAAQSIAVTNKSAQNSRAAKIPS
jgi:hypothetical protein